MLTVERGFQQESCGQGGARSRLQSGSTCSVYRSDLDYTFLAIRKPKWSVPLLCHKPHEEVLQTWDVGLGESADWRPFQLSTIHSQRRDEFAGGSEGSGGGVGIGKQQTWQKRGGRLKTLAWEKKVW